MNIKHYNLLLLLFGLIEYMDNTFNLIAKKYEYDLHKLFKLDHYYHYQNHQLKYYYFVIVWMSNEITDLFFI